MNEEEATRMPRRTMTVPEAAAELGISRSHAYELCNTGRIPAIRLGKRFVIPRGALAQMLGEHNDL